MQLRHLCTLVPAAGMNCSENVRVGKVSAACFSPNNRKLAVCGADGVIRLFDEQGVPSDKFSTKPADRSRKSYIVRALAFSPDSAKLAVAQSDSIVFIYKIGVEWGDKKSICNKFLHASPVTALTWPSTRPNESVYCTQRS